MVLAETGVSGRNWEQKKAETDCAKQKQKEVQQTSGTEDQLGTGWKEREVYSKTQRESGQSSVFTGSSAHTGSHVCNSTSNDLHSPLQKLLKLQALKSLLK